MFEVGKKVICIKSHSLARVLKGQVFELLGIKKGCCTTLLDVGKNINTATHIWECSRCGRREATDILWLGSILFVPYDDSLSSITADELIESLEYQTV